MVTGAPLTGVVKDWGGFEQLVEQLHDTGEVTVERNVILVGRSGAPRQIDVLVRHKQGFYEHKVVVECRYWRQTIKRTHVDAMVTTVAEVGADRGVIFTTKGFQSGAVTEAEHQGIRLFKVREPTAEEWGLPGRHVDMWIHVVSLSLGNVRPFVGPFFPITPITSGAGVTLNLIFDGKDPSKNSQTRISYPGRDDKTLEALVMRLAQDTGKTTYIPNRYIFDGGSFSGEILWVVNVNFEPLQPVQVFLPSGILLIPKLTFKVGLQINQSRLQIDRASNFLFALAVEDCVNRTVTSAWRRSSDETTTLAPLEPGPQVADDQMYKNGSILQAWMGGFQPFDRFIDLEPGRLHFFPSTTAQQPEAAAT